MTEATGLRGDELEGLWRPLARYETLVRARYARRRIGRAARPMLWSRFCKHCLASDGRWSQAWRLPWFVACPIHRCLLSSTCPRCGRPQRRQVLRYDLEPQPSECSVARPGSTGRGEHRCGARLTDGPGPPAAHPPVLAAQARLAGLIGGADDEASRRRASRTSPTS
ncbi:MAG: TniQ family protein [Actinomycetota bacterium]|nr:TniQ family protein [Actinomycetota bacterium]